MQSRLLPERLQQMNYSLLHFCKKKKKIDSLMWKLHILGDMLMHEWLEPPGRGAATGRLIDTQALASLAPAGTAYP